MTVEDAHVLPCQRRRFQGLGDRAKILGRMMLEHVDFCHRRSLPHAQLWIPSPPRQAVAVAAISRGPEKPKLMELRGKIRLDPRRQRDILSRARRTDRAVRQSEG